MDNPGPSSTLDPSAQGALLAIVRKSLEHYFSPETASLQINDLAHCHAALRQPGGCFVSLHRRQDHRLRGCMGMMMSAQPLAQTAEQLAVSVLQDPRFSATPVTAGELPSLQVEITVLSPLVPRGDPEDFDPQTEGIYLQIGRRAGCFLPQVARDTGWSRTQLLTRLCTEKMGLAPDAWNDPAARLHIFNAQIIGPVEL